MLASEEVAYKQDFSLLFVCNLLVSRKRRLVALGNKLEKALALQGERYHSQTACTRFVVSTKAQAFSLQSLLLLANIYIRKSWRRGHTGGDLSQRCPNGLVTSTIFFSRKPQTCLLHKMSISKEELKGAHFKVYLSIQLFVSFTSMFTYQMITKTLLLGKLSN